MRRNKATDTRHNGERAAMSETRTEIDARKWREAIKLRRPNYRFVKKCCTTCRFCKAGPDGDLTCMHNEIRTLPVNPTLRDRREFAMMKVDNVVAPNGICDAWEK